jgi:hypothetical protein
MTITVEYAPSEWTPLHPWAVMSDKSGLLEVFTSYEAAFTYLLEVTAFVDSATYRMV